MSSVLDQLREKLGNLPENDLQEVLTFVDRLGKRTDEESPRGSVERLIPLIGAWSFEAGELDEILGDVQRMRELELES